MAYIINSYKNTNLKNKKKNSRKLMVDVNDKVFFFILILSSIVIAIDYALILKFMEIIKNI